MLLANYGPDSFYSMKDNYYWYIMEPCSVDSQVKRYTRIGPEHETGKCVAERKSCLGKFLDCITRPFQHLFEEPEEVLLSGIRCMDPLESFVPDWIVEHFEKFKNVPGTFCFYELDGELFYSLLPSGRIGLSEGPACSYVAYRTLAEMFGLKLPPVVSGSENLWVFNKLGENFQYPEDLEAWRELVRRKTGCNVCLARATSEDNQ